MYVNTWQRWRHWRLSSDAIFVVCSHTFTLFWLRKMAVTVKIFWQRWHHWRLSSDAIFVMCSHTFTLFWLRKMAVTIEIFWLSFHVFTCACPMVISPIFGKSFHFPFPYFALHTTVILSCRYLPSLGWLMLYQLWESRWWHKLLC